jgi:hypothetical protein
MSRMTYMRSWKSYINLLAYTLIHKLGHLSQGLSVPLVYFFFKNQGVKHGVFLYGKCKTHVFSHTKTHQNTCILTV